MGEVRITVRDNGNLKVDGQITLVDAEGNAFALEPDKPIFLCRCGHSESKPFCDASHRRAGFASAPRAGAPADPA